LEFSFDSQTRGQAAPGSGSNSASDRLKKAIERNRAKQSKREQVHDQASMGQGSEASLFSSNTGPRPAVARPSGGGLGSRLRASDSGTVPNRPKRPTSRLSRGAEAEQPPAAPPTRDSRSWGSGLLKGKAEESLPATTRKSVAKADNVEFVKPMRKAVTRAPAKVGYATAKRKVNTKSKKGTDKNFIDYLVKFGWAFCSFLLFRLIFSAGGVMDYYSSLNLLDEKHYENQSIIDDNKKLAVEIKKIGKDSIFQKKLVRDNLGFIARDEYLILFAREKSLSSN